MYGEADAFMLRHIQRRKSGQIIWGHMGFGKRLSQLSPHLKSKTQLIFWNSGNHTFVDVDERSSVIHQAAEAATWSNADLF